MFNLKILKNKIKLKFIKKEFSLRGSMIQKTNIKNISMMGDQINMNKLLFLGKIISLVKSFTASAKG